MLSNTWDAKRRFASADFYVFYCNTLLSEW
jgi:hypothetical protein